MYLATLAAAAATATAMTEKGKTNNTKQWQAAVAEQLGRKEKERKKERVLHLPF
jgi:hypothetical protein